MYCHNALGNKSPLLFLCKIKQKLFHSAHCYQMIDLPVKKGPLLIYGYNSDLLYLFRQYTPMLLYVAKQRRYSIGQYTPMLLSSHQLGLIL